MRLAEAIAAVTAELNQAQRDTVTGQLSAGEIRLFFEVALSRSAEPSAGLVARVRSATGDGPARPVRTHRVTVTLRSVALLSELTVSARLDDIRSGLAGVSHADEAVVVSDARWRCREAAALLGAFTAGSLRPGLDPAAGSALGDFIAGDCERVATPAGGRWRLTASVREATVRRMASQGRLADALIAEPEPFDIGRIMAAAYLRKTAPALPAQSADQLQGTLQAIEWLDPAGLSLPGAGEVRRHLALAALLSPLRALAADNFVGRADELRRLTDYVEVLPASSLRSQVSRTARRVRRLAERPPLVIHGPGGVGKSTLVARFALDHADREPELRIPFAYLSFDRADLIPRQPLTLLTEAVRQLRVLFPVTEPEALRLEQAIQAALVAQAAGDQEQGAQARARLSASGQTRVEEHDLLKSFAQLVERAAPGQEPPNVWLLDTFEQAQRYGPDAVDRLWRFLDQLQEVLPRQRTVFSGRAPLDGYPADELYLHGFDRDLALSFLRAELAPARTSDKFLASVASQVGANPLSLKLAAELLRREGAEGLRQVETRRRLIFKLGTEEIQGVLYRRILDHLDDPDLRHIANPGLVVRRVTPDIIAEVLAGPCGLGPVSPTRARQLFGELAREVSLVEVTGDALVHRTDVRRTMLPLLARDDPGRVRSIHERAVRYYHHQPGTAARAEELYHRLALGHSTRTLDRYWDPAAGALLETALDELPSGSRAYLANRLGIALQASALTEASDDAWIRQVSRTARGLLDSGRPEDALSLLRRRQASSVRSRTAELEVEALAMLGDVKGALELTERSLTQAADDGRAADFVKLALVGARVAEDNGRVDEGLGWLRQAHEAADAARDDLASLAVSVAELRFDRRFAVSDPAVDLELLRADVVRRAGRLSYQDRNRNPALVRDLAAEVGADAPVLLAEAARLAGLDLDGPAGGIIVQLVPKAEIARFRRFEYEQLQLPLFEELTGQGGEPASSGELRPALRGVAKQRTSPTTSPSRRSQRPNGGRP
jgi:hypothetical protein